MTTTTEKPKNITPIGRASYPNIFEPRAMDEKSDPNYSITLIFDKDADLSAMKAAANQAVKDKWGDKQPKKLESPFRDGNEKEGEEYKDRIFVNFKAKATRPPGVVGPNGKKLDPKSGEFYPGCYARVSFSCYAWEYMGKCGVSFGLNNVQKTGDGEPFDGRRDPEDEFEAVASDDSSSSDNGAW